MFSETLGGKKEEEEEGERKGGCLSLSPAQSTAPPGSLTLLDTIGYWVELNGVYHFCDELALNTLLSKHYLIG